MKYSKLPWWVRALVPILAAILVSAGVVTLCVALTRADANELKARKKVFTEFCERRLDAEADFALIDDDKDWGCWKDNKVVFKADLADVPTGN